MQKIYIYRHRLNTTEAVVRAISDDRACCLESESYSADEVAEGDHISGMNAVCADRFPGAARVWVESPEDHPILAAILAAGAPAQEPTIHLGEPLCGGCEHNRVCVVVATSAAIGAQIHLCREYTPRGET